MTDSLRAALDIIAASPSKDAPDAIGVSARNIARAALAADTARPGLEEAWTEAEAALPEGCRFEGVFRSGLGMKDEWVAAYSDAGGWFNFIGPTPADALRALGVGSGLDDGEHCQSCGRTYPLGGWWHAPDDLWAEVTGETDGNGLRCPECFGREAEARGITLVWSAARLTEDRP